MAMWSHRAVRALELLAANTISKPVRSSRRWCRRAMDAESKASITVTSDLGAWVGGLSLSSIPESVLTHLKLCVLDSLGCGLFGAMQQWGKISGDVAVSF